LDGHDLRANPTAGDRAGCRRAGILLATRPPDDRLVAVTEQSTGDVVPERWNAVGPKSNMWMDPAQDPRFAAGAEVEGEGATLLDYLRAHRLTLELKCAGLDAEQFVAGSPDLAIRSPLQDGTTVALREVILHMVEEYARHLGHADLLRERIDGRVGQ
jgi:hypothetical protein